MSESVKYFDNAAQAAPHKHIMEEFMRFTFDYPYNQEAAGIGARIVSEQIQAAAESLKEFFPHEDLFFAHTGTDALNCAVRAHFALKPGIALTSKAEHPALIEALKRCAERVEYFPLIRSGEPDYGVLQKMLEKLQPSLFAFHCVNAETGKIQDAVLLKSILPEKTLFLFDTVQAIGKIPVVSGIADYMACSGCKIGAPGGALLFYRKNGKIKSVFEKLRFSEHFCGRVAPAMAVCVCRALHYDISELNERMKKILRVKQVFLSALNPEIWEETVSESSPYIAHLLLKKCQGAIVTRALGAKGFAVSAGSACRSETDEPSPVLRAMGIPEKKMYNGLRISFWDNSENDAAALAHEINSIAENY